MYKAASAKARQWMVGDWLQYQMSIHPSDIEMGLERVSQVADNLGILPLACPVITVAGTNGKGSTVAMFEAILRAAGYRTGSYTSPHIYAYNERIKVAGQSIKDDELCNVFAAIEHARGAVRLTFFEYSTLAALYWFASLKPDVVILETGLGGRLDAVNIVDAKVAVITSIDIDHTEWLGKDRQSIGREKAGITRSGRPCICGDPNPPQSITDLSKQGVKLQCVKKDFDYHKKESSWDFYMAGFEQANLPLPALFGDMQLINASCVLAGLAVLKEDLPVTDKAIRKGLTTVNLSGRFQIEHSHAPHCGEFLNIFDIAHNPQGARTMMANLAQLPAGGALHVVFSIFSTKDVRSILEIVSDSIDHWYISQNSSSYVLPVQQLYDILCNYVNPSCVSTAKTVSEAYQMAHSRLMKGDKLLTFGSMVTVSEALMTAHKLTTTHNLSL